MMGKDTITSNDLDKLLSLAVKKNASDVHLVAGRPPIFRIDGELAPLDHEVISSEDIKNMVFGMLNDKQKKIFQDTLELDISYMLSDKTRFRVNLHIEKGNITVAMRHIPHFVQNIQQLGLPESVGDLARKLMGLVIVTGPAGVGKSTTLAAMIEIINKERKCMVISIEDPVEYIHESSRSIVKQREVGTDTLSFANALKHVLRQDPNVILVGEIRDLESISMAITAAGTGHLVLTTLHTPDAVGAVNRIIDAYPPEKQYQVRAQLAECLEGVVAQILLPKKGKAGRVAATEVLLATQAVRHLIRTGATNQLYSLIQTGSKLGMQTMDDSLAALIRKGLVEKDVAMAYAKDKIRVW
ncbi:MAG: type IV pilus twitching motility protein PilT [Candidatus Omnitrophota bacterium]